MEHPAKSFEGVRITLPPSSRAAQDIGENAIMAAAAKPFGNISPISLYQAWADWALHLTLSPLQQSRIINHAFENYLRLLDYSACSMQSGDRCIAPNPTDKRFADTDWTKFPFNIIHQSFLLTQDVWHAAATSVGGVSQHHENLVDFYSRQFLDMLSPSNFPLTNPEIIDASFSTSGQNFINGLSNFIDDYAHFVAGAKPPGGEVFVPGKTVAITPGKVVFRNNLFELIQYQPSTKTVHPEPILITPAWIMKYYILDLEPQTSLIRYLVEAGFTVFAISWINPGSDMRDTSFDAYRENGVETAIDTVQQITKCTKMHTVGYCLGGTLLAVENAHRAAAGNDVIASMTLLASQVDFSDAGELTLFTDESQIRFTEALMAEKGYLDSNQMAGAFQLLRSQDMIWSKIIRHYMLGEPQRRNALMAWNADGTRMPMRMHSEYLRSLFLNNELATGQYRVDGKPIFLEQIPVPVFVVATETDHVSPWKSVFKIIRLLDTETTFLLTNGGHNAGIISEPGHPHRHYRMATYEPGEANPDEANWFDQSKSKEGSWWPAWTDWLATHSGSKSLPPVMGPDKQSHKTLCDAPGTYVHMQ